VRDKYKPVTPAETVSDSPGITVEVNGQPITEPVRQALNQASAADAATEALKAQIAALKRGEEIQRRQIEQQAELQAKAEEWKQSPPSHQQILDHWEKNFGMQRLERLFLEENPALIDNPQITAEAARDALEQGLERGSDAFNQATLMAFNRRLNETRRQMEQPTRPAPIMAAAPERDLSAIVSAPVSREAPSAGDGSRTRLGQVRLSAEERQFARQIGLSETEYAKQKQRLVSMQLSGEAQR
jgi:hypothetical protein